MTAGKIYIGTSGWSYKHWREIYYPASLKPTEYLGFLAAEFPVTEINTSFYHLPKPETIEKWIASVKRSFYFCPKISRYITHIKKLNEPETTLPRFFELFDPFVKHLGPVLLQLPPNLAFHLEKAEHFFTELHKYKEYHFALEPRHVSWMQPDAIALLEKYHIAFVIADSGNRFASGEFVTAKDIYVRMHGPDGSYATSYTHHALQQYAVKCKKWLQQGHHVWVFFNNDIHGYAIDNARTLQELVS